ncbi:MAG TPA: FAD-dependent oxidoreductase [Anaerolineales bacterium]|nr:FAD-dependent oxidoreductase [Anaerolineales bacterium]
MSETNAYFVAVIGAGPSGLFGARELANQGAQVVVFNRDIKPGGLAEYGVYPDKHKMKDGFRKQFRQALAHPNLTYYGNLRIGAEGDLTLEDLRALGFQAILVTVGAQGTKWLGLPGEKLVGSYHAKDLVYYYNKLPLYSEEKFRLGRRCAIIGAGNVMMDIAHFMIHDVKAAEVIAVVRRGPGEVNFTKEEMTRNIANLDLPAFDAEMNRVLPALQAVHQDPELGRHKVLDALPKAEPKTSETRFRFEFLSSPLQVLGEGGWVSKLEVEDNILVAQGDDMKARGTGHKRTLELENVIFAVGDKIDASFGLPTASNSFVMNPSPCFPVDAISYEAFDPDADEPIRDVFVGGWARKASEGLVGYARKDGTNASKAVWQYLQTLQPTAPHLEVVADKMKSLGKPVVTKENIQKLEAVEAAEAKRRGLEEFKFATNEEMLLVMGLPITGPDQS